MFTFTKRIAVATLTGAALCGMAMPAAYAQGNGLLRGQRRATVAPRASAPRGTSSPMATATMPGKPTPGSPAKSSLSEPFLPPQISGSPWGWDPWWGGPVVNPWWNGNIWGPGARFSRSRRDFPDWYLDYMYAASSVIGSQGQLLSGAGDQLSGAGNYAGGLGQYLQGEADIVRAQAEFMKAQMDAFKTQQEVHKQKLENRRLQFDQTRYEEANTPTFEERREQSQMEARRRAMTNPPLTEIWTAKSLNDLLPEVQNQRRLGVRPPLALGEEALEHINVTKGKGGNLGLLKSEGELSWPQALRQPAYAPMRNQLDRLTQSAVKSARATGQVDAGTLHDLSAGVQSLSDGLKRTSKDVSPPKYIEAKRFLNDLSDAVTALGQDDVAENFFHNEAIQGQTVAELIDYMTVHGLRFAPAVSGDEQAYVALHRALVACVGSSTLTAKQ